jgi:branched-chain amino acid transport system substrate-binding protein
MFINDIHSLGLKTTQGMYLTDAWYWNQTPETRAWGRRFFEKMKRMPSFLQAGDYSAALQYLMAVKAAGTDDADAVMAQLKKQKINDMFAKGGVIRVDGRMVHDMYLMQVKTPEQSKDPWDYFNVVQTIPGDQAYLPLAQSKCSLVKK